MRSRINQIRGGSRGRTRLGTHGRGQALVEFALIFPVFLLVLFGLIEFTFILNAQLSLNYATRDAALIAAEAGNDAAADCLILNKVNEDLNAPTAEGNVAAVHIFSATETGGQLSPAREQVYTRGGSTSCGSLSVPYTLSPSPGGYPYNVRCNDLDRGTCSTGYTGPSNTGVDIIGVQIDYTYRFVTPLGSTINMSVSNEMRMEPVL